MRSERRELLISYVISGIHPLGRRNGYDSCKFHNVAKHDRASGMDKDPLSARFIIPHAHPAPCAASVGYRRREPQVSCRARHLYELIVKLSRFLEEWEMNALLEPNEMLGRRL
jgi:hypothetical protein